jgi:hypothetical protein
MSSIDDSAGADAPGRTAPISPPPERRPWGVWASLALYVLIFEVEVRGYEFLLKATGLKALLDSNYVLHSLDIIVAWGINLLTIVLAVCLTRVPVRCYLGWVRPRIRDVALGITIPVVLYAAFCLLLFYGGGAAGAAQDYRAAIAAGMSPWWFVLKWWPTLIMPRL